MKKTKTYPIKKHFSLLLGLPLAISFNACDSDGDDDRDPVVCNSVGILTDYTATHEALNNFRQKMW